MAFCQSSENLQDALLTKLLGQLIELHTVLLSFFMQQFGKLELTSPLKAFIW